MPVSRPVVDSEGQVRQETHYTAQELADMFGVKLDTVRRHVQAGDWPHSRDLATGGAIFRPEDVRTIIERSRHE